jgi:hypothetical protein
VSAAELALDPRESGDTATFKVVGDPPETFILGRWPKELDIAIRLLLESDLLAFRRGTEDLIEIRVANGRAIYRIVEHRFEDGHYRCRLEYDELDPYLEP